MFIDMLKFVLMCVLKCFKFYVNIRKLLRVLLTVNRYITLLWAYLLLYYQHVKVLPLFCNCEICSDEGRWA